MADLSALHSMLIELHSGMLTLAALCILAVIVNRFSQRKRKTEPQRQATSISMSLNNLSEKVAQYAEPTSYLASIGGFAGLVISSIVGFYAWPAGILVTYPLTQNKIMMGILSMEFWAIFLAARTFYGKNLWANLRLSIIGACAAFAGFFFMVLTGSLGAHMMAIHIPGWGSVLDPLYDSLSINPNTQWISTGPYVGVIISILVAFILLFRFFSKTRT